MIPALSYAQWRLRWAPGIGQAITLEHIIDRFPRWMAAIARELGERDPSREVVWL